MNGFVELDNSKKFATFRNDIFILFDSNKKGGLCFFEEYTEEYQSNILFKRSPTVCFFAKFKIKKINGCRIKIYNLRRGKNNSVINKVPIPADKLHEVADAFSKCDNE